MAKIGLIQVDVHIGGSLEEKWDRLYNLAENCLKEGADLVFMPESYQYKHCPEIKQDLNKFKKAIELWQKKCSYLAKKYHAYVVPWDYYIDENNKMYNSAYILGRDGEFIGRYCKCQLTIREQRFLSNGTDYPVFDLDIGKIGIMICFDNYYPESAAALASKGAQLILYPLWGDTFKPGWELKLKTRAIDHSLFVASCQTDKYFDTAFTAIVSPKGEIIEKLTELSSYKVVEINMNEEVISHTSGVPEYRENLKDYLHKCRNYNAFDCLTKEGVPSKSWEEIFQGNVP